MPLVDAYIKCDELAGSYKPKASDTKGASAQLEQVSPHEGWSELYTLDYTLDETEFPRLKITKPVDAISNNLYLLYLRKRSRDIQSTKADGDISIQKLKIELCRWVDTNDDGVIDDFQVFLEYLFEDCRVVEYSTEIDCDADDLPEETVSFAFRKMTMNYYHPNENASFNWDFTTLHGGSK